MRRLLGLPVRMLLHGDLLLLLASKVLLLLSMVLLVLLNQLSVLVNMVLVLVSRELLRSGWVGWRVLDGGSHRGSSDRRQLGDL